MELSPRLSRLRGAHLDRGSAHQFLPSPSPLSDEAIETAQTLDYDGVPVKVVKPEYPVALYAEPSARAAKRRERAAMLLEWPGLNRKLLRSLIDMDSASKRSAGVRVAAPPNDRVSAEDLCRQAALRQQRIALPLPEKVKQLLELQHIYCSMVARQRPLRSWERP